MQMFFIFFKSYKKKPPQTLSMCSPHGQFLHHLTSSKVTLVVLLPLLAAVAWKRWAAATLVGRNTLSSVQAGQRTHRWSTRHKHTKSYTQYLTMITIMNPSGRVLTHRCGRLRPAIPRDSCRSPGPRRPPRSCSPEDKWLQGGSGAERQRRRLASLICLHVRP